MTKKQAIFVVGAPGSGKDVIIRDIASNYNILEFTSTQIDEMLSDDISFKKAKPEKQNSLLFRESIIVNCKSYSLDFLSTKYVLESVDYTTHLVYVHANMNVSFDRVKNRNLKESLVKISSGNSNKLYIFDAFDSKVSVDNSENLDLSECRSFLYDILEDLKFESKIKVDDIIDSKKFKKTVKSKIVPDDAIIQPQWGLGTGTINYMQSFESISEPDFSKAYTDASSIEDPVYNDNIKRNTSRTLTKAKKVLFKPNYPKGIQ